MLVFYHFILLWYLLVHLSLVAPSWSTWQPWGSCDQTCGGGRSTRLRSCNSGNTSSCEGSNTERRFCNTDQCPVIVSINNATEKSITLNCSSIFELVSWTYTAPGGSAVKSITNQTYSINSSKDVGFYECESRQSNNTFQAINLTTPSIRHTGKSITFITDQVNQTILCTSYSYPTPVFTWSVLYNDGQVENITESTTKFYVTSTNNYTSSLTIPVVSTMYRGTYTCTVNNLKLSDKISIKVRVHQRLAALWAFFGIVAEVAVIVFIIHLIRKKASNERKSLGVPFQDSNSSEDYPEHINSNTRYRSSVRT